MQVSKLHKVLIHDNDLVSFTGFCSLVDKLNDFRVVNKEESLTLANCDEYDEPDVVFCKLPAISGDSLIDLGHLLSHYNVPFIGYAPSATQKEQHSLINLGISSLIVKKIDRNILNKTLLITVLGGIVYPNQLLADLKASVCGSPADKQLVKVAFSDFRQRILQLLSEGYSAPQVAEKLHKSVRTIEWHKQRMMELVGVSSTRQLLLFAVAYGIIKSPFALHKKPSPDRSGTTMRHQL